MKSNKLGEEFAKSIDLNEIKTKEKPSKNSESQDIKSEIIEDDGVKFKNVEVIYNCIEDENKIFVIKNDVDCDYIAFNIVRKNFKL